MKTKITKATVKSFIKNHPFDLYINIKSSFNGMVDCCMPENNGFTKAEIENHNANCTLGIKGAWFVGSSRDYFNFYEDDQFTGIDVYNSCGNFILAIKNQSKN